jgi:hypothetical protein
MKQPPETLAGGGDRGKQGDDTTALHPFRTHSPRRLRALAALLVRSQNREALDRAAGCSNGPDLIAELRRRGLSIPCDRVPVIDRDGQEVRIGVYHLTASDRRKVAKMIRQRGIMAADLLGMLIVTLPIVVILVAGWAT